MSASPSQRPRKTSPPACIERPPLVAVPSHPALHLVAQEGQLQVHTAPYRGSFSVVLSEALRAAGLGRRVMVAQFLKGGVHQGPNRCIRLCGKLEWLRPDVSSCLSKPPNDDVHASKNVKAVEAIWKICQSHLIKGDLDQLVLDEVGLAIALGYLKENEVLSSLEAKKGGMDVIITGPSIPSRVMAIADQVTELRRGF
ncbi:cob(I)yrinic acid a,c-diamide adenosyltransferase [Prochlorococcus sp. MIT 1300]|uniref:cob(I)yrinic acid a,c-diamide adenosyltransferase n=1 Tax=Prochlorococcus sp. MIT 1300 TaxID=3096218 RepID=UPI002A74E229|nr:cob(I)yrinic acid a,c-diamide adenosyltransferase [Prochlorococcus sp. MIT 1300]